ncbi:DMT family transporter [Rheinheimera sp. MMS21-TC3]|uniref:DMT family transporter n=1 Tax=Rheinheimera sp. MMS21-TC3 TaxID=3072790 RepID=UPI0028C3E33F|nr:DMT family transporter [Rheinheimera sp. MMS21-TC3]WNO61315.1 DMT family transporter [Rheinheimera sp. MMS21-TC3]
MAKNSIKFAIALLVIGNIVAVFSDALIKTLSADGPIYQFVLFRQLSAILILLPFCLFNREHNLLVGIKWHILRGHIWLFGAICMVLALNNMPLATANAIFYAAPLIMLPLAMLMFQERLTKTTILVAVLGFVGVLIVIKPTHISWAAIFAFIVAFTVALNNILIRKLPKQLSVFQILLLTNVVGTPAALALAIWEGKAWDWSAALTAAGSSSFILVYAGICVLVYRSIETNKVASAEYTGLLAAVAVGIIWFNEIPDLSMLLGAAFIILPLLWLAKQNTKPHKKTKEVTLCDNPN